MAPNSEKKRLTSLYDLLRNIMTCEGCGKKVVTMKTSTKRRCAASVVVAVTFSGFFQPVAAFEGSIKKHKSCETLLKKFPNGVAESKAAANKVARDGFVKPKVSKLLYRQSSKLLDRNNNGVMCVSTRMARSFAPGISSTELLGWVDAAVEQMAKPPLDFMGMIWPVGTPLDDQPDPQVFDGAPFSEHTDVLSPNEIKKAVSYFRKWQLGLQNCTKAETKGFRDGAAVVKRWIEGAADVATAPDPCFNSRSGVMAWTAAQDKTTAKETFFHESYHGLSNYLLNRCAPIIGKEEDSLNNLRWFGEGTAEYFGLYMAAKDDDRDDYTQKILKRAFLDLQGDPRISLDANAYVQAAAMVLMIQRGLITESKILDGSYFHSCNWIKTFDPSQAEMIYIFENFKKIEYSGGRYFYSESAVSG